jgi:DNA-binding SARP family transcriptional activator
MAIGSLPPGSDEHAAASFSLIGPFGVAVGGEALLDREIGSRKGRTVLKVLAVHRGSVVPVDQLIDILWADDPPAKARENVASLVSRLRARLGAHAIEATGEGYRLAGGPGVRIDLDEVAALVEEAESRLGAREPALALVAARQAAELAGRGALLDDDPYADWAAAARAELVGLTRRARRATWRAAAALDAHDFVIRAAQDAIADDSLDEEAYRALMIAEREVLGPGAALATYERLRDTLANELGADPAEETSRLQLTILRDERPPSEPHLSAGGPASRPAQPSLVGRDTETARLEAAWARAAASSPSLILLAGEAGIGKTRLASELADTARAGGALVLSARCYEAERSTFLQPILDALRGALVAMPPDAVRIAAGEWPGTLADVLPEVGAILRPIGYVRASPDIERRRAFDALATFLRRLARRRPVLLFVDDLQNAGPSTLDFLHFLTRRLSGDPILLLGTVRTGEGEHALRALSEVAQVLGVGPLEDEAVLELAETLGAVPGVAGDIVRRTRGHTLFVIEALRTLDPRTGSLAGGVPDSLREAIVARASTLGPEVEDLLRSAATLGPAFDLDVAAEIAGAAIQAAVARAERALRAGLLVEAGSSYEFANDLVQEVLYATTPGPTRTARHLLAASLLSANPEAVGRHAAAAGEWGRAADAWLEAGVRALRRYASGDAVRMLDLALDAARSAEDPGLEAIVLLERGRAGEKLAHWTAAIADHTRSVQLARESGDRVTEMLALRELGGDAQVAAGGTTAACVEPLRAALAIAEELQDAGALASTLARLCVVRSNQLRFDEGIAYGDRALEVARRSGDEGALALALDGVKMSAAFTGDLERLTRAVGELEPIARRQGDLWLLSWALFESAVVPMAAARYGDAADVVRSAAELARRIEEVRTQACYLCGWSWIDRATGRYGDALRRAGVGTELAERVAHPWWTAVGNTMLAWIWSELADPELAAEHGARAVAAAERDGVGNWLVRALAHRAWAEWAAGDQAAAAAAADRAEEVLSDIRTPPGRAFLHGAHAAVALARVRLGQGRHDRVSAVLEPVRVAAERAPWQEVIADTSIVLGRSLVESGSPDRGGRLLTRAAEVADRNGLARASWEAHAALARPGWDAGSDMNHGFSHAATARAAVDRAASTLEDPATRAAFERGAFAALDLPDPSVEGTETAADI